MDGRSAGSVPKLGFSVMLQGLSCGVTVGTESCSVEHMTKDSADVSILYILLMRKGHPLYIYTVCRRRHQSWVSFFLIEEFSIFKEDFFQSQLLTGVLNRASPTQRHTSSDIVQKPPLTFFILHFQGATNYCNHLK